MADDLYATPKVTKKVVHADAFPVPSSYPSTDQERIDGLQHILEGLLRARDYQELASVAGLAHRYHQLAHIIYQVDDIIAHGGTRRRR